MKSRRIFFLGLITVAIVLSASILVGFQLYRGTVEDQHETEVTQTAAFVQSELDTRLRDHQTTVTLWARNPDIGTHGTPAQQESIQSFVNETDFSGASVIAANGTMTSIESDLSAAQRRNLTGQDFSDREYFQQASQGDTYVSAPVKAESGNYIVTISTPIRQNGTIVGTFNAAFHLGNTSFFGQTADSMDDSKGLTVQSAAGNSIYTTDPDPSSDLVLGNATLTETNWSVTVSESQSVIQPAMQQTTYLQFGMLLTVLFAVAGFGWWNYRRNLTQVEHLLDGFETLGNQNYGTEISVGGTEEWERIGTTFNELSHTLDRYITEREEREQELRQFRRGVEAAGHAVFLTDARGTIEYANPAFEDITGYTPAEAIGRTPRILSSGKHDQAFYEDLWETILAGDIWDESIVNRRKDGELYHANQTVAPIMTDGEVDAFVAIQTDITERKEREKQLQVLARALRHNLRNDMSVIRGRAEKIRAETDGTTAESADSIVAKSEDFLAVADKQRDIIETLLESPDSRSIDVCSLLQQVTEQIQAEYPDASVTVECPDDAEVTATRRIEQAVEELLTNAITHSDRENPDVGVRVEMDADWLAIEIADDGPRIPEMERQVLGGEEAVGPLYHGSGLGLWLVYWIVRRSGGTLTFEENDPRGNVVRIELPR